jgi:hypothetical protein
MPHLTVNANLPLYTIKLALVFETKLTASQEA